MGRRVKRGGGEPARGDKEWTVGVIGTYGASKQGQDVHGKMKLRVREKVAERTQSHVSRNRHSKKREGGGRAPLPEDGKAEAASGSEVLGGPPSESSIENSWQERKGEGVDG